MYLCERCHTRVCSTMHVMANLTLCQVCGTETECVDCGQVDARKQPVKWEIAMYLHVGQIQYTMGDHP